jgi:hypothetical protein
MLRTEGLLHAGWVYLLCHSRVHVHAPQGVGCRSRHCECGTALQLGNAGAWGIANMYVPRNSQLFHLCLVPSCCEALLLLVLI